MTGINKTGTSSHKFGPRYWIRKLDRVCDTKVYIITEISKELHGVLFTGEQTVYWTFCLEFLNRKRQGSALPAVWAGNPNCIWWIPTKGSVMRKVCPRHNVIIYRCFVSWFTSNFTRVILIITDNTRCQFRKMLLQTLWYRS